jgi:hypothetical protein
MARSRLFTSGAKGVFRRYHRNETRSRETLSRHNTDAAGWHFLSIAGTSPHSDVNAMRMPQTSIRRSITPFRSMAQPTISPTDWLAPSFAVRKTSSIGRTLIYVPDRIKMAGSWKWQLIRSGRHRVEAKCIWFNVCRALALPLSVFSRSKVCWCHRKCRTFSRTSNYFTASQT